MKILNVLICSFIILSVLSFASCQDDEVGSSNITIPSGPPTELDLWLDSVFCVPYNISVNYKWNSGEMSDPSKDLIPPKEDFVQPFMKAVLKIWIKPYTIAAKTKEEFMKNYASRNLTLIGSGSWNNNSVTLGLASSGYKITLYTINSFDLSTNMPRNTLQQFFRTMHHEFGHVLNQRKPYNSNFKNITGGYSADWTSKSDAEARELGFISAYARSADTEDFVEILSFYVCNTEQEWDAILNSISSTDARSKIRQKAQSVISYMKDTYGVDIVSLRLQITTAITEVANGNLD